MTAKIIALGKRARSSSPPPGDLLRIEKSDGNVLLTAGELQLALSPAQAKEIGEYLTVLAVVLGNEA